MSRLSERLLNDIRKQEIKKIKKSEDIYDEDEETMDYIQRPKIGYLNDSKSKFRGFGDTGINNAQSVFDAQATFRTGNN